MSWRHQEIIKKNTHPENSTVLFREQAQASTGVVVRGSDDMGAGSVPVMCGGGAKSRCLDGITDGAWTHTRQVDFGDGAHTDVSLSLRVKVPACSRGGCPRLTLHLDALGAAAVAPACQLSATSGKWATATCPVGSAGSALLHGVHDLFLLFQGQGRAPATALLNIGWWQLASSQRRRGRAAGPAPRNAPAKAAVQLTMRACSPRGCTWAHPVVANTTGVPVGVVAFGTQGSVLAAKAGVAAAHFVLEDNEDGTYGLRVGTTAPARYACATPQPAANGQGGGALLSLSAPASDTHCARFRVQVMTGGAYALRSVAIGLWVRVGAGGVLTVDTQDPRSDPATALTFTTTLGLPPH